MLFIDLRDHYGLTQCVADPDSPAFKDAEKLRSEWVVRIDGKVRRRPAGTENPELPTGAVELYVSEIEVLGPAGELPLPVFGEQEYPEDIRLKYRFLDLRRDKLHQNIMTRGAIVDSMRKRMKEQGFFEFQTPILTASSPEGARDFLVPSRIHPGKFYALPQAPQQYKQLLMMSGFDRYFQIAPCFRDEDPRADRLPGEFYQLDVEMSFVDPGRRLRRDGAGHHRRVRGFRQGQARHQDPGRGFRSRKPCANTAATSPICAIPLSCRMSPSISAAPASRCSRECSKTPRTRSGPFPDPAAAHARSATG